MIAACPNCKTKFRIARERLGTEGVRLRCTQCASVFRVKAPETVVSPPTREAPIPAAPVQSPAGVQPTPVPTPVQTPGGVQAPTPVQSPAGVQAPTPVQSPAGVQPTPVPTPGGVQPTPVQTPGGVQPTPVTGQAPAAAQAPAEEPAPESSFDAERLVVVAHSDAALAKRSVEMIDAWGLQALAVHDGVEAILAVQRHLPRAVVLDAALPKMYGFQVCELMKRNESLRTIQVVLVGAIHDDARYRRTPGQLYGADVYLETPDLPEGLQAPLCAAGLPVAGPSPDAAIAQPPTHRGIGGIDTEAALEAAEPAEEQTLVPEPTLVSEPTLVPEPTLVSEPTPLPIPAPTDEVAPAPLAEPPEAAPVDPAVAEAERLARIIVSDVVLYNEEKFAAAVADGSVIEVMEPDLQEGRSLFQARIDPDVAGQRDFLRDELLRVAKQRGMS